MPVDPGQPPGVEPGHARLDLDLEHRRPPIGTAPAITLRAAAIKEEAAWTR
jgi:hypothetical protein